MTSGSMIAGREIESRRALPEDDPFALSLVEQNHREGVAAVTLDALRDVDTAIHESVAHDLSVVVAARGADVSRREPHRGTRAEGRGGLSAARDGVMRDPQLRGWAVRLRKLRKAIDVVDGVGSDADDVKHRQNSKCKIQKSKVESPKPRALSPEPRVPKS